MLDKPNKKISVLNKMIGLGEEVQAPLDSYTVPQNSITTIKTVNKKTGLNDGTPVENTCNLKQGVHNCKCPHCENMAKNFLYLESLIRSNTRPDNTCTVCHSSLQYLQHVNKSILQVFGNFDAVAEAAKAFGLLSKDKKPPKLKSKSSKKLKTSSHHSTTSKTKAPAKKRTAGKKFNTSTQAHVHVKAKKKTMGSLNSFSKPTGRQKKTSKRSSFHKDNSTHSTTKSTDSSNKSTKMKKLKVLKGKTQNLFRKLKSLK